MIPSSHLNIHPGVQAHAFSLYLACFSTNYPVADVNMYSILDNPAVSVDICLCPLWLYSLYSPLNASNFCNRIWAPLNVIFFSELLIPDSWLMTVSVISGWSTSRRLQNIFLLVSLIKCCDVHHLRHVQQSEWWLSFPIVEIVSHK